MVFYYLQSYLYPYKGYVAIHICLLSYFVYFGRKLLKAIGVVQHLVNSHLFAPALYFSGEVYICGCGGSEYVDEARLLPGGDLDRAEVVEPDPKRVAAAAASFKAWSPPPFFVFSSVKCSRPVYPYWNPVLKYNIALMKAPPALQYPYSYQFIIIQN